MFATMPLVPESFMNLTMLAQDPEGSGRGYWFIALMVILAIQHFAEKIKEKREAERNLKRGPNPEEEELQDFEEGYSDPAPSNETLADFFRSLTQSQSEPVVIAPPPVAVPPPRPPAAQPRPPAKKPAAIALSHEEKLALAALKKRGESNLTHGRTHRQRMHASAQHSALGNMLRNPVSLRNAFILKEILDPPVSAREDAAPYQI